MLCDATGFKRIIIACGYTDLRFGIDGLEKCPVFVLRAKEQPDQMSCMGGGWISPVV